MGRKGRCEQLGAVARNRRIHGSQTLESLKLTVARGLNTVLLRPLRSLVEGATPSDCRDKRGRLGVTGMAVCDDYPAWGSLLRPIS